MSDNVKINVYDNFTDCDGKKCGLGKHVGAGNYICQHNNLQVKYPELIKQWHPDNKLMNSYLSKSNQKVKWICEINPCQCHIWESRISDRTLKNDPKGCPYCKKGKVCMHNNLEVNFPELKDEWHPDNPKPMNKYTSHTDDKVWWICSKVTCKCHIWESFISNRTRKDNPSGCPFCNKNKACKHNNLEVHFPELKIEWDPNNLKQMCEYSYGSHDKVWWICSKVTCECHRWESFIYNRTKKDQPSGCPFCNKNKACIHNNLEVNFSELKHEWHPDNPKPMNKYTSHADDKVWWICSKVTCKCHIWGSFISNRTRKDQPSGCPFCKSGRVCIHKNLEIEYPRLKIEWYPDNPKPMNEYSSGSSAKVKWMCTKNSEHLWDTFIRHRTKEDGTNCPQCSKSKGYSDAEINWITKMEKKENIIIRNALSSEGQFKIPGVGKVDGYCESNNTVYEFHGDFWHGNPSIYNRNEINPVTKTTFGELYDKTIKREQKIRDLGFNLIVKWETDFSDIEPKVEELDDVFYIKINNKSKSSFTHH